MGLIKTFLSSFVDALPPYREIDGLLEGKEPGYNGTGYILMLSEKIEVDTYTLETLGIGQRIKVRYTRRRRAISIDRYTFDDLSL